MNSYETLNKVYCCDCQHRQGRCTKGHVNKTAKGRTCPEFKQADKRAATHATLKFLVTTDSTPKNHAVNSFSRNSRVSTVFHSGFRVTRNLQVEDEVVL